MSQKRYSLIVRGRQSEWSFGIDADPAHVEDWRADGLQVFESCNEIPAWLPRWATGLVVMAQDALNWRPWR